MHPGEPPFESDRPNPVWTVDFKGEFRLGDKRTCYPLIVQETHSRFVVAIRAQSGTTIDETMPWFRRILLVG